MQNVAVVADSEPSEENSSAKKICLDTNSTRTDFPEQSSVLSDARPISAKDFREELDQYVKANQPKSVEGMPVQELPGRTLKFQMSWFQRFPWLHFSPVGKSVLCFLCAKAHKENLMTIAVKADNCFISRGFVNWKRGIEKFSAHEKSACHTLAISQVQQKKQLPILAQLSNQKKQEQERARVSLLTMFSSLRFLLRQGLAIRGHNSDEGNYELLLKMRSNDVVELKEWLCRTTNFTAPDCQNEMLAMLSHTVLRTVVAEINDQSQQFAIMVDGTQDSSGVEQESICIRHVDSDLNVREQFVGLYQPPDTTAMSLAAIVKDALIRLNLPLENLRAQTYDGANNMSGIHNGCQALIASSQPLALHFHCAAHCANLVAEKTINSCPLVRDAVQWAHELGVNFGRSGKFRKLFPDVAHRFAETHTSIRPLCPTRWLCRASAIKCILTQYKAVVTSLSEMSEASSGETAAKYSGLLDRFQQGKTVFGLTVALEILSLLEQLNVSLQARNACLGGMLEAVEIVRKSLSKLREDCEFGRIMESTKEIVLDADLHPLTLPRVHRPPARFSGQAQCHHADTVEDHYKPVFCIVIDTALMQLAERFDINKGGLQTYIRLERVLLEGELDKHIDIVNRYPELCLESLEVQLAMFMREYQPHSLEEARKQLQSMHSEVRRLFGQVSSKLQFVIHLPTLFFMNHNY